MSSVIKQAVILSAGLGTRLRPITDTVPKPMIPLLGKPMLEWNIEQFKRHGVTEFFLNLHYLPEVVKSYFNDGSKWGVKIHYNFEPEIRGTAGGVKGFSTGGGSSSGEEYNLGDVFYLIYGDMLSLVDYSKMAENFWAKDDPIGMQRTKKTNDYADADVAEVDENLKFIKIHPKPHVEKYVNAHRMRGVFIFKKEILSYIPENQAYEIGKQLLPSVVDQGKNFYGYECSEYSKGIDTIDKYQEVEEYLKSKQILCKKPIV
ncbi:MAG: nucleotidyltransferase family protein [bacterium]|nr:nucleotidyltransferase family protein [bacterium]